MPRILNDQSKFGSEDFLGFAHQAAIGEQRVPGSDTTRCHAEDEQMLLKGKLSERSAPATGLRVCAIDQLTPSQAVFARRSDRFRRRCTATATAPQKPDKASR